MGPIRGHRANVCLYRNWTATNHYSPKISLFIPFIICSYAHKYLKADGNMKIDDEALTMPIIEFNSLVWHLIGM